MDLTAARRQLAQDLGTALDDLASGALPPEQVPDRLLEIYTTAFLASVNGNFGAVAAMYTGASQILGDLGRDGVPGFVVGDGGELDRFHDGLRKELAKFDQSLAQALAKTLAKARSRAPDGTVFTGYLLPFPVVQLSNPTATPGLATSWVPRAPLFFAGYGDGDMHRVAFLGTSSDGDTLLRNAYDGAGMLLESAQPVAHLANNLFGGAFDVPAGAPTPHGNIRVEVDANGAGWTFPIGY